MGKHTQMPANCVLFLKLQNNCKYGPERNGYSEEGLGPVMSLNVARPVTFRHLKNINWLNVTEGLEL
jgi:hypothetical protein